MNLPESVTITNKAPKVNVKQAVPFFMVSSLPRSLAFYCSLGFTLKKEWVVKGEMLWCWIELGSAALMLQEFRRPDPDAWQKQGETGVGVTICLQCEDALALYSGFRAVGVETKSPFVGNNMWVVDLTDPDGYRLSFESPTDAPEESILSDLD